MLRAYANYLRQCGFAYSTRRIASVLGDHPELAEALIDVVETSFHPDRATSRRVTPRSSGWRGCRAT